MVLQMWVPGLTLPAHPALVHASTQRSAMQPDAALQGRLGSHATLAQAAQDQLALVPTVGAAKRKVGSQLKRNRCGACCWSVLVCVSRPNKWSCQVAGLLLRGTSLQSSPPEMKEYLDALVTESPTAAAGAATLSGRFQGTWEVHPVDYYLQAIRHTCAQPLTVSCERQVFSAPHIASLGTAVGTRFDPIRYRLEGDRLVSNVRYRSSLAQARPSADGGFARC